jgi:ATP-dependent Lon protease
MMRPDPPSDRPPRPAQALQSLPVFPLPQTVLFPGALMPLHIFESRYRTMVRDCLATHKTMAVALIRGREGRERHGRPAIEAVAGLGVIIDHVELPDGRYNILLCGRSRVRLEELPFVPPYRRARAVVLAPIASEVPPRDVTALLASASAFAADIRARDPDFDFQIPAHATSAAAADLAAHHLVLDARERQAILEMLDIGARIRRTTEALALQHAALSSTARGPMN